MSLNYLELKDIENLVNLLLRSQQSKAREALCIRIGVEPYRLSFIRDSSDSDFVLQLIEYLDRIGNQESLCKLCCEELLPIFGKSEIYASILGEIAVKLHCNYELRQNTFNNKNSTHPLSNILDRVSVNFFNQLIKNKLILRGKILLIVIGLAGFGLYYNQYSNCTSPLVCNVQGNTYKIKNDYNRAIAYYNKAIRLNSSYIDAYYNRGLAYAGKSEWDKAIEDYNLTLKLNPNYTEAYYNRGLAYKGKMEWDKAIEDLNQTLKLNPNYSLAKQQLQELRTSTKSNIQ